MARREHLPLGRALDEVQYHIQHRTAQHRTGSCKTCALGCTLPTCPTYGVNNNRLESCVCSQHRTSCLFCSIAPRPARSLCNQTCLVAVLKCCTGRKGTAKYITVQCRGDCAALHSTQHSTCSVFRAEPKAALSSSTPSGVGERGSRPPESLLQTVVKLESAEPPSADLTAAASRRVRDSGGRQRRRRKDMTREDLWMQRCWAMRLRSSNLSWQP